MLGGPFGPLLSQTTLSVIQIKKKKKIRFLTLPSFKDVAVVPAEQQLEVQCDRQQLQQHDMDIAVVPAEQQLKVQCDRQQQQQHDNDVAVVSAEQQLEIHSDKQQQQQSVSVLANYCVKEHLHVNGNGQGATIEHPGEKHSQLLDCNNTPNQIPAGI